MLVVRLPVTVETAAAIPENLIEVLIEPLAVAWDWADPLKLIAVLIVPVSVD